MPSIRKYGYYALTTETAPVVKAEKNPNRVEGQYTDASVYVAHKKNDRNHIKIGQSHNPKVRVSQIKGMDCNDIYQTSQMPRELARALEAALLDYYSPFKTEGEFFYGNFEEVCRHVQSFDKPFAKLLTVPETRTVKTLAEIKALLANQA